MLIGKRILVSVVLIHLIVLSESFKDSGGSRSPFKESIDKNGRGNQYSSGPSVDSAILKTLSDKVQTLESEVQTLESEVQEDIKIRDEFTRMVNNFSTELTGMKEWIYPDANLWNKSDACGGIIVSQYGTIYSGFSYSLSPTRVCIWTVRVNYRSQIMLDSTINAETVTVTEFQIDENGTHSLQTTRVDASKNYVFRGPLILVKSVGVTSSAGRIMFNGFGKFVHQDVEFRHYIYKTDFGAFSLPESSNRSTQILKTSSTSNSLKTKSFTTIVVLKQDLQSLGEFKVDGLKDCDNTSSSSVLSLGSQALEQGCCNETCGFKRVYALDGSITLARYTLGPPSKLSMTWKSVWTASNGSSMDKCGGVLIGKTGTISYRNHLAYKNNERCVWVIYPFPRTMVKIQPRNAGFESTYDHLVLTTIDSGVPTSRRIQGFGLYSSAIYAHGKVVLLTFYSDSSIVRTGFEIQWEAMGDMDVKRGLENEEVVHTTSNSKSVLISKGPIKSPGFSLHIIENKNLDRSSLNLTLTNVQSNSLTNCNNTVVKLIGSALGMVSYHYQERRNCSNEDSTISSPDGIAAVYVDYNDLDQNLSVDVSLKKIEPTMKEEITTTELSCGGAMHGQSGRIVYKLDKSYSNNERCIWIIHTPTSPYIKLHLQKDGFETCCDIVLVNKVNLLNGTLSSNTHVLNRENNTYTSEGPVIVVTFRSDASVTGTGFTLAYQGVGEPLENSDYSYKVLHESGQEGSFHYPVVDTDGWDAADPNLSENAFISDQMIILGYSSPVDSSDSATSTNLNVAVDNVKLAMDANCTSDSLHLYSTPSKEGFHWAESYPKEHCEHGAHNECTECLETEVSKNDTVQHGFKSGYRAFVAIYKPAPVLTNRTFSINWEMESSCGGILTETSGAIAYKVGVRYKNSEQCIWTVESPGASKIRFTLYSSGFEICCDHIILNSLNPRNGTLSAPVILQRPDNPTAIMEGPVVFVTFRTDISVTGEGFILNFAPVAVTPGLSNSIPYHHIPFISKRKNYRFSFSPATSVAFPGLAEIATFVYTPDIVTNESYARRGSDIILESLNLRAHNISCTSDTLRLYHSPSKYGYNLSRSYEIDFSSASSIGSANASCNEAVEELSWICPICLQNETRTEQLTMKTVYPGFIAIYKTSSYSLLEEEVDEDYPQPTESSYSDQTEVARSSGFKRFSLAWKEIMPIPTTTSTSRSMYYHDFSYQAG